MTNEGFDLPVAAMRSANRILRDIESAGSMIVAVKNGAKAHGFVIGLTCAGVVTEEQAEVVLGRFDEATEKRLKELAV